MQSKVKFGQREPQLDSFHVIYLHAVTEMLVKHKWLCCCESASFQKAQDIPVFDSEERKEIFKLGSSLIPILICLEEVWSQMNSSISQAI